MESRTLAELLDAIGAKSPTPGGGAVASVTGALAASLAQMVVNYSLGKKSLTAHQESLTDAMEQLRRARGAMLELAAEDAAAYAVVNELMKLPEDDERRRRDSPGAVEMATQAPLATGAGAVALLRLFESLAPITNRHLRSDLAIAAILAEACLQACAENVRINLSTLRDVAGDARADAVSEQLNGLLRDGAALRRRVIDLTS